MRGFFLKIKFATSLLRHLLDEFKAFCDRAQKLTFKQVARIETESKFLQYFGYSLYAVLKHAFTSQLP